METGIPASSRSAQPADPSPDGEKAVASSREREAGSSPASSFETLMAETVAIGFVKDPDGRYVYARLFLVEHLGEPVGADWRGRTCRLIAEGIDTEAERATLRSLGIRLGQGCLVGRPLPANGP
jgi:hypothetical protein